MVGRVPKRQWSGLSWAQQREILRLARRRRVHPDPALRDAAYRWAVEIRAERLRWISVAGLLDSGTSWAEWWAARKILRAEHAVRAGELRTSEGS